MGRRDPPALVTSIRLFLVTVLLQYLSSHLEPCTNTRVGPLDGLRQLIMTSTRAEFARPTTHSKRHGAETYVSLLLGSLHYQIRPSLTADAKGKGSEK